MSISIISRTLARIPCSFAFHKMASVPVTAYELTPVTNQVPEPSVLAFFGTVCLGMAVRAAARRYHNGERLPRS